MPTRLYLVRHGATTLTAEDRFAGSVQAELSDIGRGQLRALASRLRKEKLEAVYASPMVRTMESARIVSEPHGLPIVPREGLREIDHGHWETLTRAEVEQRFPDEYAAWEADPYSFAPKGGESGLAVTARALPALLEIVESHPNGKVLVVSHKATIRLLISSFLGIDPRGYRDKLDQSPACLNVLDFKDARRARLALYNDVSHYEGAETAVPSMPTGRLSKWWSA